MTLANTLRKKLANLDASVVPVAAPLSTGERQLGASGRHDLQVSHGVWNAYLSLDKHDELSCLIWEVTLRRNDAEAGGVDEWAAQIVQGVTGLLEPLSIYEIDLRKKEALLRSKGPTRGDGKIFYYELHLQGNSAATLRRFQACEEPGQKRQQISFALTTEVLVKLVSDLTGV